MWQVLFSACEMAGLVNYGFSLFDIMNDWLSYMTISESAQMKKEAVF
jgi:hypothetical protein